MALPSYYFIFESPQTQYFSETSAGKASGCSPLACVIRKAVPKTGSVGTALFRLTCHQNNIGLKNFIFSVLFSRKKFDGCIYFPRLCLPYQFFLCSGTSLSTSAPGSRPIPLPGASAAASFFQSAKPAPVKYRFLSPHPPASGLGNSASI